MPTDQKLISKVAFLYYKRNLTQQEISDLLGISRYKVLRLIQAAIDNHIVSIEIRFPDTELYELQDRLEDKFKLAEVVIFRVSDSETLATELGKTAANYLLRILRDNLVIGVGFSQSVYSLIDYLPAVNTKECNVVQIIGGMVNSQGSLIDLPFRLADRLNAKVFPLFAPLVVDNGISKDIFLQQQAVKVNIEQSKRIDVALVGIGELSPGCTLCKSSVIDLEMIDYLVRKGAVGDINARFFDINGNPVDSPIEDLVIGLSRTEISELPRVVAIAGGEKKTNSILGALRTGLVDVIIIDFATAKQVLLEET